MPTPKRRVKRSISVFYQPPQVSTQEINRVIEWYKNGVPLDIMVRKLLGLPPGQQGKREVDERITYVDLYSILYVAIRAGQCKQRQQAGELSVAAFVQFFVLWKEGGSKEECLDEVKKIDPALPLKFFDRLWRTTNDRLRMESGVGKIRLDSSTIAPSPADQALLNKVLPHCFRVLHEGEYVFMLQYGRLPYDVITQIAAKNNSVSLTLSMLLEQITDSLAVTQDGIQIASLSQQPPEKLPDPESIAKLVLVHENGTPKVLPAPSSLATTTPSTPPPDLSTLPSPLPLPPEMTPEELEGMAEPTPPTAPKLPPLESQSEVDGLMKNFPVETPQQKELHQKIIPPKESVSKLGIPTKRQGAVPPTPIPLLSASRPGTSGAITPHGGLGLENLADEDDAAAASEMMTEEEVEGSAETTRDFLNSPAESR